MSYLRKGNHHGSAYSGLPTPHVHIKISHSHPRYHSGSGEKESGAVLLYSDPAHSRSPDEVIASPAGEGGLFGAVILDLSSGYFAVSAPRSRMYGASLGGTVHVYRR